MSTLQSHFSFTCYLSFRKCCLKFMHYNCFWLVYFTFKMLVRDFWKGYTNLFFSFQILYAKGKPWSYFQHYPRRSPLLSNRSLTPVSSSLLSNCKIDWTHSWWPLLICNCNCEMWKETLSFVALSPKYGTIWRTSHDNSILYIQTSA